MAVMQPGPSGSALVAALEAARSELQADVLRGAGGRSALERYSDRVDAMLRQRLTSAAAAQLSGDRLMPALADTLEHACEDIMNAPRADFAMVVA